MRIFFISFWCLVFSAIAQVHASDNSPKTNWGGVFKVPVEKIDAVDRALKNWGNWIKETHPLGPDDENNLVSLSITKSEPANGHVYYVIVEIYPTPEGLMNHTQIYGKTHRTDKWRSTFTDFGLEVMRYRINGSTQKHTVYHLVPSKDH